ncbi:hypothetical protein PoB_003699500 [Plakobranchus ocellatus]|uniref:Uncharacterized protein n=1 Tax=Plakobranchus ocellatus TaxID=259542 RepID=A0AAV4AT52_9GAST|nr:hypothetical protein PoB_003699500 [Plakobranchus ocellatus]
MLAECKSVCHKGDENSRAGLLEALSSCGTDVSTSCENDGCRHPAGSPALVAPPTPNATKKKDLTSRCLFHTLEDPHATSISSTNRLQSPAPPSSYRTASARECSSQGTNATMRDLLTGIHTKSG